MSGPAISIMGDSISTFEGQNPEGYRVYYAEELRDFTGVVEVEDTWWSQVISHFGGHLCTNASFSGSMVEGLGFPAGNSERRVADLKNSSGENPDAILIFMGINDFGWGGAKNQAAGRSEAVPPCVDLSLIPEADPGEAHAEALEGFARAYRQMLERLRSHYPDTEIWPITLVPGRIVGKDHSAFTYQLRSLELDSYNDAIRQAAKETGCRVADIFKLGLEYEAKDGTHPTGKGMAQLASMIIQCLEADGFLSRYASVRHHEPEREKALKATRYCYQPSCVPCSFAQSTSSKWSCVCEKPWLEQS